MCERDLKVYAESFGAKVFHYQDYANREIDAVIELDDGKWCAFEIKLGANQIDSAAAELIKISEDIKNSAVRLRVCFVSSAVFQMRLTDGRTAFL